MTPRNQTSLDTGYNGHAPFVVDHGPSLLVTFGMCALWGFMFLLEQPTPVQSGVVLGIAALAVFTAIWLHFESQKYMSTDTGRLMWFVKNVPPMISVLLPVIVRLAARM